MSETYPFARFWRCALQVNPAGYHASYRGSDTAFRRLPTTKPCWSSARSWTFGS